MPTDHGSGDDAPGDPVRVERVVDEITERTARGIAAAVNRLITSGQLVAGDRLPTVRQVARAMGVSPTTVSDAWQILSALGAVEGRGRQGTFVGEPAGPGAPVRYRRITEGPGHFSLDLSSGIPDPALLPNIATAIASLPPGELTASYLDPAVLPALERHLIADWPFAPEAFTVVDGAMDALDRIAQQCVRMGDRVIVENPTFPPVLDLLDHLGADIIGVPLDESGIIPDALAEALEASPVALFCQLRAHNPTGISTTPERVAALAKVLVDSPTLIVEDDHSADIASAELVSIGRHLPQRTVHIRSFSKSHGPDLRLAAIGGEASVVRGVANRRMLGPGWSSRILQSVLLAMLRDPDTTATVDAARQQYAHRRRQVCEALARHGVPYTGSDGINLWVQVRDERAAMLALAAHGVGVAPGEPFFVDHSSRSNGTPQWIRVTTAILDEHRAPDVADLLASAATLTPTWRS